MGTTPRWRKEPIYGIICINMYLLTVAPIGRGLPMDSLSYLAKSAPPVGSLLNVPLQRRTIPALVLSVIPARDVKADIKNADFTLRRPEQLEPSMHFEGAFIAAAEAAALRAACSLGSAIQTLFPTTLLKEPGEAKTEEKKIEPTEEAEEAAEKIEINAPLTPPIPSILQAESSDRISTYKRIIRETFARGKSLAYVLPTIQDIARAQEEIGRGIEDYTFVLHSDLTKKQLRDRITAITNSDHSILVITTPQFLAVPFKNCAQIILERESAAAYTMTHRPFLDLRHFVEAYARAKNVPLLIGDLFLRIETLSRTERGELELFARPKSRYAALAQNHLVDMRTSGEQPSAGRVAFFSRELTSLVKDGRRRSASTFIFCVRRGIAPMTVCGDCGTLVHCESCDAPLVLHRKAGGTQNSTMVKSVDITQEMSPAPEMSPEEVSAMSETLPGDIDMPVPSARPAENIFMCHRCGTQAEPKHKCTSCGSWRMTPLGLGIAQAEEILRARFPDAPIIRLDADVAHSQKEILARAKAFAETPGAIMLGTEMAIPYLPRQVGVVGVLSVNSLLTAPDFRMNEHVFRLLLVLRERARDHFIIQTRDPLPVFNQAVSGSLAEFVREEIDLRKELNFPPASMLIKLSASGKGLAVRGQLENACEMVKQVAPEAVCTPPNIFRVGDKTITSSLVVLPHNRWPNPELRDLFMSLSREITVRVDPKNIISE